MKKIFLFMFVIYSFIISAEISQKSQTEYSPQMSLQQLSVQSGIPVKKLKNLLNLNSQIDNNIPLENLNIDKTTITETISEFAEQKHSYYSGIVLIGMLIVFVSLITIGFVINQLRHLHLFEKIKEEKLKKKKPKFSDKENSSDMEVSSDAIIAAITAVYLHELEVEEQHKFLLTWKRTPVSMWKAISRAEKPNELYFNKKN
ncbi:MAG: hypothetical protein B6D62_02025 [Candidatus Cloacimonas sp. 4484_275]|nr:MAG: hypothetical protein B6D62_02025 [Candidatus Cloacimonas sp. 4484_275]RLC50785.1 MAG: hypothetical protein DRZ79_03860 [Candidatus Cloacimonadota bacterium]